MYFWGIRGCFTQVEGKYVGLKMFYTIKNAVGTL